MPIVANHEKGCWLSQNVTRWAIRLCFVHDQTSDVWAFWYCGCKAVCMCGWCVRLVALVSCVYICGAARLNNFRLEFPVRWTGRKLLGFPVKKPLTGNSKPEMNNFWLHKKQAFCSEQEVDNFRSRYPGCTRNGLTPKLFLCFYWPLRFPVSSEIQTSRFLNRCSQEKPCERQVVTWWTEHYLGIKKSGPKRNSMS